MVSILCLAIMGQTACDGQFCVSSLQQFFKMENSHRRCISGTLDYLTLSLPVICLLKIIPQLHLFLLWEKSRYCRGNDFECANSSKAMDYAAFLHCQPWASCSCFLLFFNLEQGIMKLPITHCPVLMHSVFYHKKLFHWSVMGKTICHG